MKIPVNIEWKQLKNFFFCLISCNKYGGWGKCQKIVHGIDVSIFKMIFEGGWICILVSKIQVMNTVKIDGLNLRSVFILFPDSLEQVGRLFFYGIFFLNNNHYYYYYYLWSKMMMMMMMIIIVVVQWTKLWSSNISSDCLLLLLERGCVHWTTTIIIIVKHNNMMIVI